MSIRPVFGPIRKPCYSRIHPSQAVHEDIGIPGLVKGKCRCPLGLNDFHHGQPFLPDPALNKATPALSSPYWKPSGRDS